MNFSSFLLIALTVFMCGAIIFNSSIYANYDLTLSSPTKIEIECISGGDRYNDTSRFQDNVLIFRHAGGKSLSMDSISVQISGTGNSYKGIPGSGGEFLFGDLTIYYEHLNADKKNSRYEKNNRETLKDGIWSPGEILILTGNDSKNASFSSVFVTVNNDSGTSNNYGLSSQTSVEISIYQVSPSNHKQLIFKKDVLVSKNL